MIIVVDDGSGSLQPSAPTLKIKPCFTSREDLPQSLPITLTLESNYNAILASWVTSVTISTRVDTHL
jgi:hypothetical protein